MAVMYLDTSVLGRVLLGEPDRGSIVAAMGEFSERVSSRLLRVELRRVAMREDVPVAEADELLRGVALIAPDSDILAAAETILPATVATLDAIHLATACQFASRRGLDALMTYDARLAAGCRRHGIRVLAPA